MGNLSALAEHHRVSPSFPLATGNHSDSPLSDHARYSNQDNEEYLSDEPARGFGPIHRRVERKRGIVLLLKLIVSYHRFSEVVCGKASSHFVYHVVEHGVYGYVCLSVIECDVM